MLWTTEYLKRPFFHYFLRSTNVILTALHLHI